MSWRCRSRDNICEFRGFVAIRKSFLRKILFSTNLRKFPAIWYIVEMLAFDDNLM